MSVGLPDEGKEDRLMKPITHPGPEVHSHSIRKWAAEAVARIQKRAAHNDKSTIMKMWKIIPMFILVLGMASLFAQTDAKRPHVLGVAHVAFRVSDLGKAVAFYENFLGYAEPLSPNDGSGKTTIALVKVNDEQYVELLQGDARSQGQLDHFALYTDDLAAMRGYLLTKRIPIFTDIHSGRVGNPFLTVRDPDGRPIEIVQYSPNSLTGRSQGKSMPAGRVSSHITHVGILVRSEGSALKFYRDILGFREFSRGSGAGGQPGWVDLQAPDGSDYIELLPFCGRAFLVRLESAKPPRPGNL